MAEGHGVAISEEFTPSTETPPRVRVVLEKEHRVAGLVSRSDGSAASGVALFVLDGAIAPERAQSPETIHRWIESNRTELVTFGRSTTREDGSFEVGGLPGGTCHVVAVESLSSSDPYKPRSTRAMLSGVEDDATDLRLILPPAAADEPTVSVEGSIRDRGNGRPISRFEILFGDEGHWRPGSSVAPGRFRVDGVRAGIWKLVASARGYPRVEMGGVVVGPGGLDAPLEVRLVRGVRAQGRVRCDVRRKDATPQLEKATLRLLSPGLPEVTCELGPEGSYEVSGLQAGVKYHATVLPREVGFSYEWAAAGDQRLEVGAEDVDIVRDIVVKPAGTLAVGVRSPRLPPVDAIGVAWEGTEEQRRIARALRAEVRDAEGRLVWQQTGIRGRGFDVVLPSGEYAVRIEIEGAPPQEKRVKHPAPSRPAIDFELP
jgi:hypothetical protein